jgi:hypothetical protein
MGYVLAPLAKAQGFCDKKAWVKIACPPSASTVPVRDQLSQKTRRQLFARIDEEIGRGLSKQNICLKLVTHFFPNVWGMHKSHPMPRSFRSFWQSDLGSQKAGTLERGNRWRTYMMIVHVNSYPFLCLSSCSVCLWTQPLCLWNNSSISSEKCNSI